MTVWCESCKNMALFFIEDMHSDQFPQNGIWGDMVCTVCRLVICTFGSELRGKVTFKVDEP